MRTKLNFCLFTPQAGHGGSSQTTATAGMLGSPFSAAAALGLNPLAAYGSAGIAGMPGLQGFQLGMSTYWDKSCKKSTTFLGPILLYSRSLICS